VDAKIASKVIAARIIKDRPEIIHSNQSGYVKGRFIGEAARSILDVMDFTKKKTYLVHYSSLILKRPSTVLTGISC